MTEAPVIHNARLAPLVRERYRDEDLLAIENLLASLRAIELPARPNGLYAAVPRAAAGTEYTGYGHTWVRDTVHVAHCAWERGDLRSAQATARSLLLWFRRQAPRFEACIAGTVDSADPMQRPHVRFDGATLEELPVWWPHAQNDALGYGLWFLARAALSGLLPLDEPAVAVLRRFPRYFAAIRYWEDRDSGHWEEARKVSASSIGTVIAGLSALRGLLRSRPALSGGAAGAARAQELRGAQLADVDALIAAGREALARLLPWESRGNADPRLDRRADAALLFLLHPLRVVDGAPADAILQAVRDDLVGPYGVRRYVGDSYWMADYKRLFDERTRTSGFQDDVASRDRYLQPGTEAQWCLFDPLLSLIHGWRHLASRDPAEREAQVLHFNRALGQVTGADCPLGEGLCPEAYYLQDSRDPGRWVPNDDTPLLWTAALLGSALRLMRASVALAR